MYQLLFNFLPFLLVLLQCVYDTLLYNVFFCYCTYDVNYYWQSTHVGSCCGPGAWLLRAGNEAYDQCILNPRPAITIMQWPLAGSYTRSGDVQDFFSLSGTSWIYIGVWLHVAGPSKQSRRGLRQDCVSYLNVFRMLQDQGMTRLCKKLLECFQNVIRSKSG